MLSFLITDLVPFVEDVLRVEGLGVPDHGTPLEDDGVVVDVHVHRRDLAQLQAIIPAVNLYRFADILDIIL